MGKGEKTVKGAVVEKKKRTSQMGMEGKRQSGMNTVNSVDGEENW